MKAWPDRARLAVDKRQGKKRTVPCLFFFFIFVARQQDWKTTSKHLKVQCWFASRLSDSSNPGDVLLSTFYLIGWDNFQWNKDNVYYSRRCVEIRSCQKTLQGDSVINGCLPSKLSPIMESRHWGRRSKSRCGWWIGEDWVGWRDVHDDGSINGREIHRHILKRAAATMCGCRCAIELMRTADGPRQWQQGILNKYQFRVTCIMVRNKLQT